MKKKALFLLPMLAGLFLAACGGSGGDDPQKSDFTGVSFESATYTYDGNEHILGEVNGAPEGTLITYIGRVAHVDAGTYSATAKLQKDGYNDKTLSATLTINPAQFSGITYESRTFVYDGADHFNDIALSGTVPLNTSQQTTVTDANGNKVTTAINAGTYSYKTVLTNSNYQSKTFTATLTIQKASFTGLSLDSKEIVYDGNQHTLSVSGNIPSFATVQYSNSGPFENVGTYAIKAVVSAPNYNDLTLNATLSIKARDFTDISFESASFEYDGNYHSIAVSGTLPSSATVTYTTSDGQTGNSFTDIGEYEITARISAPNFNTKTLKATLIIYADDEERILKWSDDTLFFQNALDNNYFYAYNTNDNNFVRISRESDVRTLIPNGDDKVIYFSKTLFNSQIKTAEYSSSKATVDTTSIYTSNISYVQYGGGDTYYYVVNKITNDNSGIYKVDLSNQEPVVTCLSVGKAKYLTLVGNYLYFADGTGNILDNFHLSRISINGENQTREILVDDKINNLYQHGNYLYYTVDNLLGNYIDRYDISTGARRKITKDAGIDFSFIGGYLYYINVDWATTSKYGSGIYKIDATPLSDNSNSGSPIIQNEKGICSLFDDGTYLYYYDMDGYKLNKATTSGNVILNILENFEKPDDPTPLSLGGDIGTYNGVLYYLDVWDGKSLHSYNPQTKQNLRLTANKVDNFSIVGDIIYYNGVTRLVNNDTYCFNLKTGGETTLINTYDGSDFVSDGEYLYYAKNNGVGAKDAIRRTNLTTLEDEEIFSKGVSNLKLIENNLLFIDGYQLFKMDLNNKEVTEIKPNDKSVHTTVFDTDGTNIYYREEYSLAYAKKRLSKYNLVTGEYNVMVEEATDPVSIIYHDGFIYYYSDTATSLSKNGLYRVSARVSQETEGTCILLCDSTYYAQIFDFLGNDIYFLNYALGGTKGDSRMYQVQLEGGTPVLIA